MVRGHSEHDPTREERRRILRRAAAYTYGFLLAAILLAALGAAFVAWLLSLTGLPFRETWLVLIVVVLAVPLIGQIVAAIRGRKDDGNDAAGGSQA